MRLTWPRHFLGLPLHPMLVHIPLVSWLWVPVFDTAALAGAGATAWRLALIFTGAGVAVGGPALASGLADYLYLSETGSTDVRLAARHGVRTTMVWCVMLAKLAVIVFAARAFTLVLAALIVDLSACAVLLQGAFFGTQITYGGYRR